MQKNTHSLDFTTLCNLLSTHTLPPHQPALILQKRAHTHISHLGRKPVTLTFYQLICCCYRNWSWRERRVTWCVCFWCRCSLHHRACSGSQNPKSVFQSLQSFSLCRCPLLTVSRVLLHESRANLHSRHCPDDYLVPVQGSLRFYLTLLHYNSEITGWGVCV